MCLELTEDQYKHPATSTQREKFNNHKQEYVSWAQKLLAADHLNTPKPPEHIKGVLTWQAGTTTRGDVLRSTLFPPKVKRALH